MREREWEGWLRLQHEKDELVTLKAGLRSEDRELESNVVTGLNGQHWREERGEMGREGGMRRWVVVSHSSPGHIRANGSLHPSDTHKCMTHMKIC